MGVDRGWGGPAEPPRGVSSRGSDGGRANRPAHGARVQSSPRQTAVPPRTPCRRELEPRRLQTPPHRQAGGGEAKVACVATQCVPHALAQEASGRRTDSTNTREQSNEVLTPGSADLVWRWEASPSMPRGPEAAQARGDSGSGFGGIEPGHWSGKTQKEAKRKETEQRANEVIRSKGDKKRLRRRRTGRPPSVQERTGSVSVLVERRLRPELAAHGRGREQGRARRKVGAAPQRASHGAPCPLSQAGDRWPRGVSPPTAPRTCSPKGKKLGSTRNKLKHETWREIPVTENHAFWKRPGLRTLLRLRRTHRRLQAGPLPPAPHLGPRLPAVVLSPHGVASSVAWGSRGGGRSCRSSSGLFFSLSLSSLPSPRMSSTWRRGTVSAGTQPPPVPRPTAPTQSQPHAHTPGAWAARLAPGSAAAGPSAAGLWVAHNRFRRPRESREGQAACPGLPAPPM